MSCVSRIDDYFHDTLMNINQAFILIINTRHTRHTLPLCLRNLCEKEGERNSKSAKESLREIEHEGLTN